VDKSKLGTTLCLNLVYELKLAAMILPSRGICAIISNAKFSYTVIQTPLFLGYFGLLKVSD